MKIEDVRGLKRRASMAEQLAVEIETLRTMMATCGESEIVLSVIGIGRLSSAQASSLPQHAYNGNKITMQSAVLGVLQSELNSRLAAMEDL